MKPWKITLIFTAFALLSAPRGRPEGGDQPWQNLGTIPLSKPADNPLAEPVIIPESEPSAANASGTTPSSPPLDLSEKGRLAELQQQLLSARQNYRQALARNPDDAVLREHYAWFLYANGYHDKECLRLLEASLRQENASDPVGLFNAIVEIRDALGLPATPLKKPAGVSSEITVSSGHRNRAKAAASGGGSSKNVMKADLEPVESFKHWVFVPSYNTTFFNKGRQNWHEEDAQLYYQINRRLSIGGEIDLLQRPPAGSNTYYSAMASYYLTKYLEVHGKISICPDPTFLATQIYSGGVICQALPHLGVLLDYQRYEFIQGPIDQISPGLVYNFNDNTYLMGRYTRGWAFYNLEYNYYSTALSLGLPGNRKLILSFAYGTDPDAEVGALGSNVTSLSPAYTYSVFFNQPLTREMNLFAGITYVYRERPNGKALYEQLTPTIGCAVKF